MRIAIGCDHRGCDVKEKVVQLLGSLGPVSVAADPRRHPIRKRDEARRRLRASERAQRAVAPPTTREPRTRSGWIIAANRSVCAAIALFVILCPSGRPAGRSCTAAPLRGRLWAA